jgi:hypothetical protein
LWRGRILFFNLLPNEARHAEVADATYAHFINEDIFEFQVGMDEAHLLVEVSNATNDLAEHRTGIVKR